jgi:hypothetical protein
LVGLDVRVREYTSRRVCDADGVAGSGETSHRSVAGIEARGRQSAISKSRSGTAAFNLCRALFFHFEDSFYQREEGLLNDEAFETVVAGARLSARSPGWRAAWRLARPNFGGRFLSFMDGVVAASAAEPPVDLSLEAWKLAFASEASRTS